MVTEQTGLPNNVVYGIEHGSDGKLWVSSNKGLASYDPVSSTFRVFSYSDGVQSSQFNYNSSLRLRDGTLCFGGIDGFNIFNPDEIEFNEYVPPVRITSFFGRTKDDCMMERHLVSCSLRGSMIR